MGYNMQTKMKKVLHLEIVVVLIIMMCLVSCTKPEKQIVGKWKIISATEGRENIEYYAKGEIWTFREGGNFVGWLPMPGGLISCKWIIDGDELILQGGELEKVPGDFQDVSYTFDIEQLDKKRLIVSGIIEYVDAWALEHYGDYIIDRTSVYFELKAK